MSPLHEASRRSDTERVKQLLDDCAPVDEKDEHGRTALMLASSKGHTEVVKLLLDRGASVDEKDEHGRTALMLAREYGHTEVAKLLLDKGASAGEKDGLGITAMAWAIMGHTEMVQLLLDKGASVDEKDEQGKTALTWAIMMGHTEVVQLLLDNGALFDAVDARGDAALLVLASVDEDHLGRMAAAQAHRHLLQRCGESVVPASALQASEVAAVEAAAEAVLNLVRLAGSAATRARTLRSSDPRSADDHQALFGRLQLAAAACIQNDESGKARTDGSSWPYSLNDVQKLLDSKDGRKALEHAVEIEAKELLAQPVVQKYIKVAWRGVFQDLGWWWVLVFIVFLLNLLFLLPLVALVPALEPWLADKLDFRKDISGRSRRTSWGSLYFPFFLHLPVVKFGLACAADLALALALTLIPAADLATAPVAPLLLVWVGSGFLWEARELMAPSSSDATSRLARAYDRLTAYWGDSINRVDATALIFSAAALVAFMSAGDSEDPTATSLRAVAVFLLWLRVIRVLLVSPQYGPFVLMFFRMLCGDVIYFLVLLLFLLVAFAASWTVLLAPPRSSIAGCADELGGVDFHTTLLRIFEGALTGNDYFECARNSTNSPVAAWGVTAVYVTLTAVLLLNMLIAMMAKTFDNISEASATNYLLLFAQRTLAHQNEPPTPPPLNVVGLPCQVMCLLWAWLHPKDKAPEPDKTASEKAPELDEAADQAAAAAGPEERAAEMAAGGETVATQAVTAAAEKAGAAELKAAAAKAAADNARLSAGSASSEEATQGEATPANEETSGEEAEAVKVVALDAVAVEAVVGAEEEEAQEVAGEIEAATVNENATNKSHSSVKEDGQGEDKKEAFAEKIARLAEKITEYILDHQDDAAQEDRWRTTMKRDMAKSFREQRAEVQKVKEEVKAEVMAEAQKIEAGVHKVETEMQLRFEEVHSKMDEKLDQLVKSIAELVKPH